MLVECVKSKKGELLIILEEEEGVYLCCRPDGIQMHFEAMQLCMDTIKEIPLEFKEFTKKQKMAYQEYSEQMEKGHITYSNFKQSA